MLGNQADAELNRYILEINIRNACDVPERVLRNIIDQMHAAGITQDRFVFLGLGRCQVVQCYDPRDKEIVSLSWIGDRAALLEALYRSVERDPYQGEGPANLPCPVPEELALEDIPF